MAKTKFFNLDTDNTLGGQNTSHYVIPSQRAVKEYIDNHDEIEVVTMTVTSGSNNTYNVSNPSHTPTQVQSLLSTGKTVIVKATLDSTYDIYIPVAMDIPSYMVIGSTTATLIGTLSITVVGDINQSAWSYAQQNLMLYGGVHSNIYTNDALMVFPDNNLDASGYSSSLTFDTSDTTMFLRHDGTWAAASGGATTTTYYGTSATAAATAAKTASITGLTLAAGIIVGITATNTNTASNPTLNINSLGAKSIRYNGSNIVSDNLDKAGKAGVTTFYMYDGTYWVYMGESIDRVYVEGSQLPTSSFDAYMIPVLGTSLMTATTANQTNYTDTLNINSGIYVVTGNPSVNSGNPYVSFTKPVDLSIGGTSVTSAGDFLPIVDTSNGNLVGKGPEFGSSTTTFLRNDGTWATPAGGGGGAPVPTPTAQDAGKTLVVDNQGSYALSTTLLSGYEVTTNKVTSLSAQSTDTQYPSAKCVYDLFGDIDNVLNAILNG